jgi:DNA-binding MarR family transcriptional regulator
MVDKLEKAGFVGSRRDHKDGRVRSIALTGAGRIDVTRRAAEWHERVALALSDVSQRDLERTAAILYRLAGVLDSL